jgi:hypothetical protein
MRYQDAFEPMKRRTVAIDALCILILGSFAVFLYLPLLRCFDACIIDHVKRFPDGPFPELMIFDTRLNAWILAWVQRALVTQPLELFNANNFFPAERALAGSEHMISAAIMAWPARIVSHTAVGLHQWTIIASAALLSAANYTLSRWATGSRPIALAVGAVTILMPWRATETGHVQLLSIYWLPILWLLAGKIFEGRYRSSDLVLLGAVLTMQLLASFYLAYFCLVSLGAMGMAALATGWRPSMRDLRVLIPIAFAGIALTATAFPYIAAQESNELIANVPTNLSPGFAVAWSHISGPLGGSDVSLRTPHFYIPAGVAILTFASLATLVVRPQGGGRRRDCRSWRLCVGLWAVVLIAFLMMVGHSTIIADTEVPLPYAWAMAIVPGFSNLRGPVRWAILIAVASPILAGLCIREWTLRLPRRLAMCVGVLGIGALFAGIRIPEFPLTRALPEPVQLAAYRALAMLPAGPVLEVPWPAKPGNQKTDSLYTLASTLHWKPIINGYTGYPPSTYGFLHEIGQTLPSAAALRKLNELTGVRWYVVHKDAVWPSEPPLWESAPSLTARYEDEWTVIYESADWQSGGAMIPMLASREVRDTTLRGTPRKPLASVEGRLSVDLPTAMQAPAGFDGRRRVKYTVTNDGDSPWPAFDFQPEHTVRLRVRYLLGFEQSTVHTDYFALSDDVGTGETVEGTFLFDPPWMPGVYLIVVDLVQVHSGRADALTIQAFETAATLVPPTQ